MGSFWWSVTGAVCGLMDYTFNLLSLENVVYRVNSKNEQELNIGGIMNYLIAPFAIGTEQFKTVWGWGKGMPLTVRLSMLHLNWVVMITIGAIFGYLFYQM